MDRSPRWFWLPFRAAGQFPRLGTRVCGYYRPFFVCCGSGWQFAGEGLFGCFADVVRHNVQYAGEGACGSRFLESAIGFVDRKRPGVRILLCCMAQDKGAGILFTPAPTRGNRAWWCPWRSGNAFLNPHQPKSITTVSASLPRRQTMHGR
jgi:hypothetical protein